MKTFIAFILALGLSTSAAAQTLAHHGDFFAWSYPITEIASGVDSFELCVSATGGSACVPITFANEYSPAGTATDPLQDPEKHSFRVPLGTDLPYMTYNVALRGCVGLECSIYQTNYSFTLIARCIDTLTVGNPEYCHWLLRLFGLCPACSA